MALKSALALSAIQSVLRLCLSFLSIKITAVYLGPAGLALVGQVGSFLSLTQGAIANAIQTGVVKHTAEREGDIPACHLIWGTAIRFVAAIGTIVGLVIVAASPVIAEKLLGHTHYWPVIVACGLCLPLLVIATVMNGVLNGLKQVQLLGYCYIVSTVVGAAAFIPAAYLFGLWGGLFGTVLSYVVSLLATWFYLRRVPDADFALTGGAWNLNEAKRLWVFYPMLLVHSIAEPATPILVRDAIASAMSMEQAGVWQATSRLSDMYTLVLTTALSMFLMPHLSSQKTDKQFGSELRSVVLKVTLITAIAAALLFLLRDLIVVLVFSREFTSVADLMPLQLLGDVAKMAGWPIRMALVIKLRSRTYMALEAGVALTQVGLTSILLGGLQMQAAVAAYAATYIASFVVLALVSSEFRNAKHVRNS